MELGFTIKGSSIDKSNRRSVIDFLVDTYILPSRLIAENIVSEVINGSDVSIYGERLDYRAVDSQPWQYEIIAIENGKFLLVSAVDFKLELHLNGELLILGPTESKEVTYDEAVTFEKEVSQGLVRIFPSLAEADSNWILYNGIWVDSKVWVDSQTWKH